MKGGKQTMFELLEQKKKNELNNTESHINSKSVKSK